MNNNLFLSKIILPLLFFVSIFYIFVPKLAFAATSSIRENAIGQLNSAAGTEGAGFDSYRDPRETAARIIRVALGLIGTIFIALAVYAGFLWMTAGGEEENITKGKKLLYDAVIGLVIILAAYSLTNFVIYRLVRSTTGSSDDPLENDFCLKNPNDDFCY